MIDKCRTCIKIRYQCDSTNKKFGTGLTQCDTIIECNAYEYYKCNWETSESATEDSSDTHWSTTCGHSFMLNDGTPDTQCMNYCMFCGKPIEQTIEE